ncbi:hypothetical protein diail_7144 [Diaporthe ilicicola]|nr:hypothetical protein diail_7144 [Diaporthe ilicicola]
MSMSADTSLNEVPAMPPPLGVQSDFDAVSLLPAVVVIYVIVGVMMIVAVGIRFYTKFMILKDAKHEESHHRQYFYIAQIVYCPALCATKYAVFVQLRRIFCTGASRDGVFWTIHFLLVTNIAYYFASFWYVIFQCVPREAIWNPQLAATARCINVDSATLGSGIVNLITDLMALAISVWGISKLQLPARRKLRAYVLFGVGFLTCGVAAAGVAYRVFLLHSVDSTIWIGRGGLWQMSEFLCTLLVACLPSFPRFWQNFLGDPTRADGTTQNYPLNTGSSDSRFKRSFAKNDEYLEIGRGWET